MKVNVESSCGDSPRVSIIIPVYNGSNYLNEAIDSALAQTYKHIEVIVVNDGSNDGGKTEEIAVSYGDKIRYFVKENGGVSSALNTGIREMTGDYFSWLSHDDVYLPNKLELQISALKQEAAPVILYGDYYIINAKSEVIGLRRVQHLPPDQFLYSIITSFPVSGCTTLIPRLCFNEVGFFNEKLKTTQDYDMWIRLSKNYIFVHMPQALIKSRWHLEQGSRTMSKIHKAESNAFYIRCLEMFSAKTLFPFQKKTAYFCYLYLAKNLKARGFASVSEHVFGLAAKHTDNFRITVRFLGLMAIRFYRWLPRRLLAEYWKLIAEGLRERLWSKFL